jgi:hypothetical protein
MALIEETEVLGQYLSRCYSVHHRWHMNRSRNKPPRNGAFYLQTENKACRYEQFSLRKSVLRSLAELTMGGPTRFGLKRNLIKSHPRKKKKKKKKSRTHCKRKTQKRSPPSNPS